MSLDIHLQHPDDPSEESYSANITHNLAPMWREAGCYEALYESAGKTAAEILPALRRALVELSTQPSKYKALDSPNGWGKWRDALPWLAELTEACENDPEHIVRIHR